MFASSDPKNRISRVFCQDIQECAKLGEVIVLLVNRKQTKWEHWEITMQTHINHAPTLSNILMRGWIMLPAQPLISILFPHEISREALKWDFIEKFHHRNAQIFILWWDFIEKFHLSNFKVRARKALYYYSGIWGRNFTRNFNTRTRHCNKSLDLPQLQHSEFSTLNEQNFIASILSIANQSIFSIEDGEPIMRCNSQMCGLI